MRPALPLILIAVMSSAPLAAQETPSRLADMEVRTFPLRHLSSKDAAQLVAPYAMPGMVFDAGLSATAITVRGVPATLARIDSILGKYDLPPQSVTLRFQLVTSTSQTSTDPRIRDIEPNLRQFFTFAGYRLMAEGTTVVGELGDYQLTLAGEGRRFAIRGSVGHITRGEAPTARIDVALTGVRSTQSDSAKAMEMVTAMLPFGSLISTELTLRLGTLAVLGSGTEGTDDGVLILLVRPELHDAAIRR